jgi:myo-inositol 2-dehydrogenase/D-chiro-inositol 1-dehydrogenase
MAEGAGEPLRLGFVGAGSFAEWTLYPALALAPVSLQAVCDLDEARARSVAGKFGTGRWYTDHRELWKREDLEALIVCMGPRARQALVREALEAGYHVFCPKPPAASLVEAVELAEVAERTGRVLMFDFQRRFSFAVREARRLVAEPEFGRLTQLHCSFCSGRYDERRGAGYDDHVEAFLLDFAVHHLDLARFLGGEVDELSVCSRECDGGLAVAAALSFRDGAVGTLQANSQRIWWRNYDRVELTGEGAYVVVEDLWKVRSYRESGNTFTENYSDERVGELTGDGPALAEFVAAVRAGREPVCSIRDGVETMRLYQALHDAVRAGRIDAIRLRP